MYTLNDTLYDALCGLETQLSLRSNYRMDWPCRRMVRTSVEIAGLMLGDGDVEDHKEAYFSLISRRLCGNTREMMMTVIVMVALFGLIENNRQARRCRNLLRTDWADEVEELYHDYRKAIDRQIDRQLTIEEPHIYTINVMENSTRHIGYNVENMVINMSGGTLVQHADLVQASGEVKVNQCDSVDLTEQPMLFCRITDLARQEGKALIVENELRSACVSAPKLLKAIRTNEALGYLDTQNLSSTELFDLLNQHFSLSFKLRTFQDYRSR